MIASAPVVVLPLLCGAIASADQPDFYQRLATGFRAEFRTPGVSAYILRRGERPKLRLQLMPSGSIRQRAVDLDAFQRWAYALDPLYQVYLAGEDRGMFSLRELVPDGLEETEFYTAFYAKVHASDEVSLLARLPDDRAIAMYFVRTPATGPFESADIGRIKAIAPALIETACLHERLREGAFAPATMGAALQIALDTFGMSVLTLRERQIVRLTLLGASARETADRLGIAEGTVKNHRKAIFRKLCVDNLGSLTALFLRSASYANGRDDPLETCPFSVLGDASF
jgi:DNA-binding CsgD family transcriptional regulator